MSQQPININLSSQPPRQPGEQRSKLQFFPWVEALMPPDGFDGLTQWSLQWICIGGLYSVAAQTITVAIPDSGIFVAVVGLCFVSTLGILIVRSPHHSRMIALLLGLVIAGALLGVLP